MQALLADPERGAHVAARARAKVLERHLGRHRIRTMAEALVARGLLPAGRLGAPKQNAESPIAASVHA